MLDTTERLNNRNKLVLLFFIYWGCCTTTIGLNSYVRGHIACKAQAAFYLGLHRKSLKTFFFFFKTSALVQSTSQALAPTSLHRHVPFVLVINGFIHILFFLPLPFISGHCFSLNVPSYPFQDKRKPIFPSGLKLRIVQQRS